MSPGGRCVRRARQSLSAFFLLLVLTTAPLAGGYLLGHADAVGPVRTPLASLLLRAGLGTARTDRAPVPAPSQELSDAFQPFWETWGYVDRDFYNEGAVDARQ